MIGIVLLYILLKVTGCMSAKILQTDGSNVVPQIKCNFDFLEGGGTTFLPSGEIAPQNNTIPTPLIVIFLYMFLSEKLLTMR